MAGRYTVQRGRRHPTYLVECFASTKGDVESALQLASALGGGAATARHRVEYIVGFALPDDEQLLLIVRGADAEAVRATLVGAGLPVERVTRVSVGDGWPLPTSPVTRQAARPAAGCPR